MIQGLIMLLEWLESSNLTLWAEVKEFTYRVTKIEDENLSLKRQLEQDALQHPLVNTLCAEIFYLKNKQEEIRARQAAFKQET